MSLWDYNKAPTYFPTAVATVRGWCHPVTGEILVAIKNLSSKRTDANTLPTYTLAAPISKTYVAGDKLVFVLTSSEQVIISNTPSISVGIGAKSAQLVYDKDNAATVGGLTHAFVYTVVAGDVAASGAVVVANNINLNTTGKGKNLVADKILGGGGEPVPTGSLTFAIPSTTGIVVAG